MKNNGPLKGYVYNLPSCCINNSLISLLSSTNTNHFSFRYGGEKFFDIWKALGFFDTFGLFVYVHVGSGWVHYNYPKVLTRFLLTIGSIMFEKLFL